ncbi:unnamed protein product, partial [Adineta steineri]
NKTAFITTMRRHSLDPDKLRRQIKSIFVSPSRKIRNLTHQNHNNAAVIERSRQARRFSVPEKKFPDRLGSSNDLDTIDEVSKLICKCIR